MARKRGVKSSIERLDKRLVDVVNEMIRQGYTIDEMVDKLQELGAHVSRSAMGRYAKRATDQIDKIREAQEVARYWGDVMSRDPNSDIGHMLSEQLRVAAFNTLMKINETDNAASSKDLMFLASTIKNLSSTAKTDIDVALLRKKIQAEAQATAKEFESQARKSDMPETVIQNTMARILGISEAGA